MEPIREDAIVLAEESVQTLGEPAVHTPHAAGEVIGVIRLDDRVEVIVLDREVAQSEPFPFACLKETLQEMG